MTTKLTQEQGAIITAYTGILSCKAHIFHAYAEKLMGGGVHTIEFGNKEFLDKLSEKAKNDFLSILPNFDFPETNQFKVDNWISIKKQLPESPEQGCLPVLIACFSVERKIYHISYAEYQRNNFYDRYNERLIIDDSYWPILFWQPLPPAPEATYE